MDQFVEAIFFGVSGSNDNRGTKIFGYYNAKRCLLLTSMKLITVKTGNILRHTPLDSVVDIEILSLSAFLPHFSFVSFSLVRVQAACCILSGWNFLSSVPRSELS